MEKRARDLSVGDIITGSEGADYGGTTFTVVHIWDQGDSMNILTRSSAVRSELALSSTPIGDGRLVVRGSGLLQRIKPDAVYTVAEHRDETSGPVPYDQVPQEAQDLIDAAPAFVVSTSVGMMAGTSENFLTWEEALRYAVSVVKPGVDAAIKIVREEGRRPKNLLSISDTKLAYPSYKWWA